MINFISVGTRIQLEKNVSNQRVNGHHRTNISNISSIKVCRHTFVCHYSRNVLGKFDKREILTRKSSQTTRATLGDLAS